MTIRHVSKITLTLFMVLIAFVAKAEEKKEEPSSKKGKKDYASFQEADMIDHGLFTVYEIDEKLYFEITDTLLQRDMLLGSRVSEISEISKLVHGEIRKAPAQIKFDREDDNIMLLEVVSKLEGYEDQNIYTSLQRHKLLPILEVFPIVAYNSDSTSYIIDVTKFFAEEIKIVSPFNAKYKLGSPNKEATKILSSASYPKNIEVRTRFGFSTSDGGAAMAIMHRSLMLLSKEPMRPRMEDKRIGYFSTSRHIFDENTIGVQSKSYITKFDISPKAEDLERYKSGELVEPAKPIVYYVDNAFPEYLQQAIIKGIEYWQPAFEAIGFKNAITAQVYPTDDPEFNPDDIRYSCIRYISQAKANAMGPNWSDPRSGEVICGDVFWWHDVSVRLRNWLFIQCAPVEPKARLENMDQDLLAEIGAYVVAHEVGHNLGLKHNMRASYAYPVDSLRSATFTQEFGTTPSIMDYARFNYIAQPGDEGVRLLPPHLGVYDYHAIKWGYQPILDADSPDEEYDTLNRWILEKKDDLRYTYGDQQMPICMDPSAQAEALGDDAVKAGTYGVKNLRYIMDHLIAWTTEENGQYDFTKEIYKEILTQHNRYIGHVMAYIGGVYRYLPVEGEDIPFFTPISKEKQEEALTWIYNEMMGLSDWALNADYEQRVGTQLYDISKRQAKILDQLMSKVLLQRITMYHTDYTAEDYLDGLYKLVWQTTLDKKDLSKIERHIQTTFVRNLIAMSEIEKEKISEKSLASEEALGSPSGSKTLAVDNLVNPIARAKVSETKALLKKQLKHKNKTMRAHYQYLYDLLAAY